MRRTVVGGLWEEMEGRATIADGLWTAAGMIRTAGVGTITAVHVLLSVATVLGAVST
jgi:hypothetical protein